MTISEKVAYLKGLAEGMELDTETKEGKLFSTIIDILEDLALDIEDLEENALDLGEEIDEISDDLAEVEDIVYGEYDDDYDDCCCDHDDDEPIFFEVCCPACENEITIDEDVLELGAIKCPNCGETLEFDLDSEYECEYEDDEEDEDEE
ncbi:MAG TPA: hypothetical protein GXZ52_05355 [Clostridiales bacterium]|nr:hypothetical protein [Clostridiales bacterium]